MTSDDQTDSYDPLVAERFAVLDRLTPPPAPAVSAEAITAMAEIAPGLPLPDAPVLEPRPVPGPIGGAGRRFSEPRPPCWLSPD